MEYGPYNNSHSAVQSTPSKRGALLGWLALAVIVSILVLCVRFMLKDTNKHATSHVAPKSLPVGIPAAPLQVFENTSQFDEEHDGSNTIALEDVYQDGNATARVWQDARTGVRLFCTDAGCTLLPKSKHLPRAVR